MRKNVLYQLLLVKKNTYLLIFLNVNVKCTVLVVKVSIGSHW